jgi:hypothetical protein
VLAQAGGLFQHADGELGAVLPRPFRQRNRGSETGGTGPDDQDIQRDGVGCRSLGADQALERQGGLMADRDEGRQYGSPGGRSIISRPPQGGNASRQPPPVTAISWAWRISLRPA